MRVRRIKLFDWSFIAALTLAGCGAPQSQPEQPPVLADNQDTAAAAQSYRACLRDAAHYADAHYANNGQLPVSQVATVIAPMCYPRLYNGKRPVPQACAAKALPASKKAPINGSWITPTARSAKSAALRRSRRALFRDNRDPNTSTKLKIRYFKDWF